MSARQMLHSMDDGRDGGFDFVEDAQDCRDAGKDEGSGRTDADANAEAFFMAGIVWPCLPFFSGAMALVAPSLPGHGGLLGSIGLHKGLSCARRLRMRSSEALGQGLACIASCVALAASDGRGRGGDGKARRWRQTSPFTAPMSKWRGQTGRGKKGHFHLLDRYIRRIDALLPEDMEDLVRPLSYKPNMEQTTRTLKITFPDETVKPDGITEQDVRDFMYPLVPEHLALGWYGEGGAEVYAMFETNEECRNGRRLDGQRLGGHYAQVRFTVDNKFRRVMEDLGHWPKSGDQEEMPPEADQLEVAGCSYLAPGGSLQIPEELVETGQVLQVVQRILEESLGSNSAKLSSLRQASTRSRDTEAFTAEVVDRTLRGILSRAARLARHRGRPKLEEDPVQMELMCKVGGNYADCGMVSERLCSSSVQAVCRMSSAKEVSHREAWERMLRCGFVFGFSGYDGLGRSGSPVASYAPGSATVELLLFTASVAMQFCGALRRRTHASFRREWHIHAAVRKYWARKNPKRGYVAELPDWRNYLPETLMSRFFFQLEKWLGKRSASTYPPILDICNSGGKFGMPIPRPEIVLQKGFPKGSWEWQMHMYGAALYWHVAVTRGEAITDVREDLLRGKSVLEVGCMRGGGARYLAEVAEPEEYVATDDSEDNIRLCNSVHAPLPPSLRYEQADACSLHSKYGVDAFDALICVEAVADIEDKAAFVESARAVLRSEGLLLLCDAFMPRGLQDLMDSLKAQHFDVEVCTDIGKWVRATGLSPVEIGESHSMYGVAACTYMRIVARKT
ncbi:unnamed protein product [Symbiodinium necroappetens]|uniref:Methyltransferase type 11 domain-containing protein n=1 Tax=Symbiodinium necroappetens TaxID=1628268 RepID=A0A812LX12_9DINO|nr:unnamed protein product [Symbiodinium necroappetens]